VASGNLFLPFRKRLQDYSLTTGPAEVRSSWCNAKGSNAMKGSCLCGAVQYEIDQLDMPILHCHCQSCRKAHSATFAPTAGVFHEHFRWIAGKEKLTPYESSPGKTRYFCSVCGSQIIAQRDGRPNVLLRIATLDEDPEQPISMHIWCSHEVPWLQDKADTKSFPEFEPGR
jgi:ADP-ribosyl-[dinitrogen reductase] hydrolase